MRQRKKDKARADILQSAEKLIEVQGYDATTMRHIAEAANVSYQTLYNYFPNKAQIVRGLFASGRERHARRAMRMIANRRLGPLEKLNGAMKLAFEFVDQHDRALWREVVALGFRQSQEFFSLFTSYYENAQARLEKLFDDARERGQVTAEVNIQLLSQTVYAIADFAVLQYIADPTLTKAAVLKQLRSQLHVVVAPYLTTSGSNVAFEP